MENSWGLILLKRVVVQVHIEILTKWKQKWALVRLRLTEGWILHDWTSLMVFTQSQVHCYVWRIYHKKFNLECDDVTHLFNHLKLFESFCWQTCLVFRTSPVLLQLVHQNVLHPVCLTAVGLTFSLKSPTNSRDRTSSHRLPFYLSWEFSPNLIDL